jgi:energy-coupling factor transporter ATP-binding protein EcfA2
MADEEDDVAGGDGIDDELIFNERPSELQPSIKRISVSMLFGRYSYDIDMPDGAGESGRLALLHGDNGSGKTTILRILWDVLSTEEQKGHKSAVARAPFRTFDVIYSDGRAVRVEKEGTRLTGAFTITVSSIGKLPVTANFIVDKGMNVSPTNDYGVNRERASFATKTDSGELVYFESNEVDGADDDASDKPESPMRTVMGFLRELSPKPPVLLADDRCLHSDQLAVEDYKRTSRPPDYERVSPTERTAEELRTALRRLSRRITTMTSNAQASGFQEEASIYKDVLLRLGQGPKDDTYRSADADSVEVLIQNLSKDVPRFAEFGLVSQFEPDVIRGLLSAVPAINRQAAYDIIFPYLESLQARLGVLNEAEALIRSFVTHANKYLKHKKLSFNAGKGFHVLSDHGLNRVLRPTSLSSGERQMLLLLCSAMLARWESSLFLIDEPELSLGVVWQRKILSSLLELTADTNIQFIVATHSIEIVTANASSLVRLVDLGGESKQLQHS